MIRWEKYGYVGGMWGVLYTAAVKTNSKYFHRIGPLGRFDLVVAMSVHGGICLSLFMRFFCVEELVWIVTRQRTGVERRPRVEP